MNLKPIILCSAVAVLLVTTTISVKAHTHLGSDLPIIGDGKAAAQFVKIGDAAAAAGNVREAKQDYQKAIAVCPFDEDPTLGLARCAVAEGDLETAITDYKGAVYGHKEEYDIGILTEYILVLNQAGHVGEAVSLYNHVVDLCKRGRVLNKMEVAPPIFRLDGSDYDPAKLQAMTHLIRAMNAGGGEDKRASSEIRQALALAPNSAIVYFYQGVLLIDV